MKKARPGPRKKPVLYSRRAGATLSDVYNSEFRVKAVRMDPRLIIAVDAWAEERGVSFSEGVRRLLALALEEKA